MPDLAAGHGHGYEVVASELVYQSWVISVRRDEVRMPEGTTATRDVVCHPGAVGVVAWDGSRLLLITQYRHPVRRRLAEIPAGLLDLTGEPALVAAQRELAEEAGLAADTWHVLVDTLTSPGMTDEAIRIYLARDLHEVERDIQGHEETELTAEWVELADAVRRVLDGTVENAMACVGILAVDRAARDGFVGLRGPDFPWPARPSTV